MKTKLIIWICMVMLVSSFVFAHSYTPLHYYTFDTDGSDTGTYQSDCDEVNGAPTYLPAIVGNGANLSGTMYFKNISFSNATAIRTMDCWANPDSIATWDGIFGIYEDTTTDYFRVGLSDSNRLLTRFQLGGVNQWEVYTGTGWRTANKWYHIVTVIGTNGLIVYYNGTSTITHADTSTMSNVFTNLVIGNSEFNTHYFNGIIDNCAFFEEEYTPEDVNWSYNLGAGTDFGGGAAPAAGTIQPYLISPTNDTYSNTYLQNFTFNYTSNNGSVANTCQLWTNETGTFVLSESIFSDGISELCYQNIANISTACGGLDTGTYSSFGNWNDGDWDTAETQGAGVTKEYYTNFTYVGVGNPVYESKYNSQAPSGKTLECYNTTDWKLIHTYGVGITRINTTIPTDCVKGIIEVQVTSVSDAFYEGAMWWNGDGNLTQNTTLNISHTFSTEGTYLWNIGCNATGFNETFATSNFTLTIDTTNPTMSGTNFTNGTITYHTNYTYQWNFTDDNFYSFFATLNGNVLVNDSGLSVTSYSGNVTVNHTNLIVGANSLYIQGADGHTAKEIPNYYWSDGLWNNQLTYTTASSVVSIVPKEGSIFDIMSTKKEKDRYTFEYKPSDTTKEGYVFIVTSNKHIDIINNPKSKWNTWLVTGNNWIDFYEEERPKNIPIYKRIKDNIVEVTVKKPLANSFKFSSIGDLNINSFNYTIYGINVSTSHSDPVIEGQSNTPYLYVYTGTDVTLVSVNATLLYNSTTYTPTKTNDTQNYTFSKTVNAPLLDGNNSNMTFYWNLSLSGGSELITLYQNVVGILIDNCTDFTTHAINFSMYKDEDDSLLSSNLAGYFEIWINPTEKVYFNVSWGYANNHSLCIYDDGDYNVYGQMEYKGLGSDYEKKTYYLYNATLNNVTQFLNLYSTANSTQITFPVTDEDDNDLSDIYIHVVKYDFTTNTYTTNSILKTDEAGNAYGELTLFTTWYKFFLYRNGVLLLSTNQTKIVTTSKTFRVNLQSSSSDSYDNLNQMTTTLNFNNVTNNFIYTFSNPTGLSKEFCLKVTQRKVTADVLVNNTCSSSASGTILVNIGAVPDYATYIASGSVSGSPTLLDKMLEVSISDEAYKTYGEDAIFMTFFVKLAFAMIGIWNPIVAIIMIMLADVVMGIMGIYKLNLMTITTYIIMGCVVIWKINRRG